MKRYPLSVQLYSVREEAKKDFLGVLKKIAAFGYDAVEFAGFHGHNPKELKKILDDLGLKTSSVHGPVPDGSNVQQIIDEAGLFGYRWHVCGKGEKFFPTKEETLKTASLFQAGADLLKGSGIQLGIHNHWYEFDKTFDGKTPHQIIKERAPDVFFEIDTYWVAVAGQDPAAAVQACGKRSTLLHIKDGPKVMGKNMTAVGDGAMDWKPILETAEKAGVEWLVVELDFCDTDMMEAVRKSRDYLLSKGYIHTKEINA